MQCEAEIEQLERMALPSLGRFDAKARQCMDDFGVRCVGPARASAEGRLAHAHERERARFQQDYNNRLYNGLVGLALAAAVLCRFIFKAAVPELIGWGVFIFLEVRPQPRYLLPRATAALARCSQTATQPALASDTGMPRYHAPTRTCHHLVHSSSWWSAPAPTAETGIPQHAQRSESTWCMLWCRGRQSGFPCLLNSHPPPACCHETAPSPALSAVCRAYARHLAHNPMHAAALHNSTRFPASQVL